MLYCSFTEIYTHLRLSFKIDFSFLITKSAFDVAYKTHPILTKTIDNDLKFANQGDLSNYQNDNVVNNS